MKNKFEELLKALSLKFDIELTLDTNNACCILFDDLSIQLEMDDSNENLIIFCPISELSPGKFRENVLAGALKENDKFPYIAILGYLEEENTLILFNYLNFSNLNAEMLSSYLLTFTEFAFLYRNSITKGQTTPILK